MAISPWILFAMTFTTGCIGGLSYALYNAVSRNKCVAGVLRSGCTSLAVSFILYEGMGATEDGQFMLLGIAMLLGMAGEAGFNLVIKALRLYVSNMIDAEDLRQEDYRRDYHHGNRRHTAHKEKEDEEDDEFLDDSGEISQDQGNDEDDEYEEWPP